MLLARLLLCKTLYESNDCLDGKKGAFMLMDRSTLHILKLQVAFFLIPSLSFALDCTDSAGMAAALISRQEWNQWCTDCGGTVLSGPKCEPGINWQGKRPSISQVITPRRYAGQEHLDKLNVGQDLQKANIKQSRLENGAVKKTDAKFQHDTKMAQKYDCYYRALSALRNNDPDTAVKLFKKILKECPDDLKIRSALVRAEKAWQVKNKNLMEKKIAAMNETYL